MTSAAPATEQGPDPIVRWFIVGAAIALLTNAAAVVITRRTFGAMGGVSDFATAVRQHDLTLVRYFNGAAFPGATAVVVLYLRPVIGYLLRGAPQPVPPLVQRRIISTPFAIASMGLVPWGMACLFFPLMTIGHFGHWSPELVSQQLLSPLVSGFLAATTTYLLLDWLLRTRIAPHIFPQGRLADISGAWVLGVRARLIVFLIANAFTPLFTMYGVVRAAVVRVDHGVPVQSVMAVLEHASAVTFVFYVALGIGLTLLFARTLTRPLVQVADALRRVQAGDVTANVQVTSSDEVGVVQDGVNAMIAALREKEHILQTFGRVVEPSVRDHLLRGDLALGGELRTVTVLFCDLRGFTAYAEHTPPTEVVATLNEFFSVMATAVRESGGFVDKFIGDAILAVFGLFDSEGKEAQGRSAAAALRCGLGMRERLAGLNDARLAAQQSPLAVAVSVHSGEVLSGRIGAQDRHEYTVIGDTVNVAARLQQFSKEQGHDLVISASAYELASRHGMAADISSRDEIMLRGRSEPVRVLGVA